MATPKTAVEMKAAMDAARKRAQQKKDNFAMRYAKGSFIRSFQNGKHRRPNPQAHSNPVDGASLPDDGAIDYAALCDPLCPGSVIRTRLPAAAWRSIIYSATIDPHDSGAGQGASLLDAFKQAQLHMMQQAIYGFGPLQSTPPAPIPYAGILAGEITGHRAWLLYSDRLCSLVHFYLWEPGQIISGDIEKVVDNVPYPIYGGVYAFRTYDYVRDELDEDYPTNPMNWPGHTSFGNAFFGVGCRYQIDAIVWGTILQWGDVVEHQKGYRSQFAKVASLDGFYGQCDLDKLRQTYGVANGSPR